MALPDEGSGYNGDSPASLRIKDVNTTGFKVVQVEPQDLASPPSDGSHANMRIAYFAIEKGDHTLRDGTRILVGDINTSAYQGKYASGTKSWDSVTFGTPFSATPVLMTMIQSLNNETNALPGETSSPWMTSAVRQLNASGFDVALDRAETTSGSISSAERVGYVAIDAGVQGSVKDTNCLDVTYESLDSGDNIRGWDNSCYSLNFAATYPAAPNVVGSMETRDGVDGGWLRQCALSDTAVGLTIDEDQAHDSERGHTTEQAGLLVFSGDFVYDSAIELLSCNLQVDFHMDECYWLGGANGVDDDVKDSSGFHLDAQSRHKADDTQSNAAICRAGDFNNTYTDQNESDAVFYPNSTSDELNIGKNQPFTVSAWLYRHDGGDKWMAAVIKTSDDGWTDGWGMEHERRSGANINFFVGSWDVYATASLPIDTWTHVVGTYDGSNIRIYTNGVLQDTTAQNSYSPGALAVSIGDDISGSTIDDRWQGNIDEVKIWNRALSASEIKTIYDNESVGLNYDGTTRECVSCSSTTIAAHTWEFIGIPADNRTTGGFTVNDVFGDDMKGTFNTDWRVYKRTYSTTDNSSDYQQLGLSDTLEFGQGFWLGSAKSERWDVDGLGGVDYNSSYNGTSGCVSSTNKCVEIALTPVTHDFNVDPNDGTGAYRYNMTGYIGLRDPVEWANCRLVFDDNGTFYTPSDANASGLANKQIWLYDPTNGSANSNGYTSCSDTSPGDCKLVPFKGFWIQLAGKTKNHTVKLIVPEK